MILVFSVHADDAIFSCGEFIAQQVKAGEDVRVVNLCSTSVGPLGDPGHAWQEQLNKEHAGACRALGALAVMGGFIDGKFATSRDPVADLALLRISMSVPLADIILVPLGIHHPDHLYFARLLFEASQFGARVAVFEDLPYRVMYPEEVAGDYGRISKAMAFFNSSMDHSAANGGFYDEKLEACMKYESQWGEDAKRCVMAPERIWWVA